MYRVLPITGDGTFVRFSEVQFQGHFFSPCKRDCKNNINLFKLKT